MRSKPSASDEARSFLSSMIERGEEVVNVLLDDLLSSPAARDRFGRTVGRAAEAKRSVDKNIQAVLSLLNLPSRADYQRLATKVEALQGSLVNVNMKLDRLLAAGSHAGLRRPPEAPAAPRRRTARKGRAASR
jgi:hypothetical protein